MKKLIFSIILIWFGIICFASCANKANTNPTVPVITCNDGSTCPAPTPSVDPPHSSIVIPPVLIKEDNWEFTLPSDGWIPLAKTPTEISKALINKDKQNIIIFVKEPFQGNFMEYSILALRDIKQAGSHLIFSKNVTINEQKFLMLETISASNHSKIWMWLTFDKGYGYMFSCGGPIGDMERQQYLCSDIINSFKLSK